MEAGHENTGNKDHASEDQSHCSKLEDVIIVELFFHNTPIGKPLSK